jgi:type II secretory pathway pseudopilin PulG
MKSQKNNFTLVEIIISMGIIVVCIVTIMGMLSAGIKMNKENIMTSQLISMVKANSDIIPKLKYCQVDSEGYSSDASNATAMSRPTKADITGGTNNWTSGLGIKSTEDGCTTRLATKSFENGGDLFLNNLYRNKDFQEGYSVFKVNFRTKVGASDTEITDFTMMARLWMVDRNYLATSDDPGTSRVTFDTILYTELSWPHNMPYTKRILMGNYLTIRTNLSQN